MLLFLSACWSPPVTPEAREAPPPAATFVAPGRAGGTTPRLIPDGDGVLYTWQEPGPEGGGTVWIARWSDGSWSQPAVITRGPEVLVNWADFPSAIRGGDGALYAWWYRAGSGHAYDLEVARSPEGVAWSPLGRPYPDGAPGEYGFASAVVHPDGIRLVWLDGRASPTALRSAVVTAGGFRDDAVVDPRTCDCCATDAVIAGAAPLVVWRDRSEAEIRDIASARWDGAWTSAPLPGDGWEIRGCPVNGPAVAAHDAVVAAAWFTGAGDAQRVMAAFSTDAGRTFGPGVEVAGPTPGVHPVGRVDVALDADDTALVTWLSAEGQDGAVRIRRVAASGAVGEPIAVGASGTARASGFPTMAVVDDTVWVAWTGPSGVVSERVPLADVPQVSGKPAESQAPTITARLPDFRGTAADGAARASTDLAGRPVLLNVWATWCGPCRQELPDLAAFAKAHPDLRVVAVSVDGPAAGPAVWSLAGKAAPGLEVWHGAPGTSEALGVSALPRTILYDGAGARVWASTGRFDPEAAELTDAFAELR